MWTTVQVQEIRGHVAKGLSRAAIAEMYGVSRNAMVGVCYRNGISAPNNEMVGRIVANDRKRRANLLRSTARPNVPEKTTADRWVRKAKPVTIKFDEFEAGPDEPAPLRVSILDLTSVHCHSVVAACGNRGIETDDDCLPLYCGHPTQVDSSYCPFHHTLFHAAWKRRP